MKIIIDAFAYIFVLLPGLAAWGCFLISISLSQSIEELVFIVLVAPFFLVSVLAASIFILRLFLPKMEKGIFLISFNRNYLSWLLHLKLVRAIRVCGLRDLIHSFFIFRFIIYRALGGKIPLSLHTSMDFELVDLPLISIGNETMLQDHVKISCHILTKEKLILRPVRIGSDCIVYSNSFIRPGTVVESNSSYPTKGEKQ